MKIIHNIYVAILILIISIAIFMFALLEYNLAPVSNDKKLQTVTIEKGGITQIAKTLHKKGLIKNIFAFKIYTKISGKTNLKAAAYKLSPNMGTKKIINKLYEGKGANTSQIEITFKEGYNMRNFIKIVTEKTNIKEEEITTALNNKEYLKELIDKYWFLTENILNDKIYYALEGYLYPDTYFFKSKDIKVEEIFEKLLDETSKKLTPYKDKLTNNKYNIHEIITLASMAELEGVTLEDRKGIVSVFINRINKGMTLGSDVTTYYGAKINMGDRDLHSEELTECNDYNTRCQTFKGLPVSPIDNPSIESIKAVLEAPESNYYYFVADKNRKVYFSKTLTEHNNQIAKLKKEGLWFEY